MEGVVASIMFFAAIVAIWGGIILTRHRERMTVLEKGLRPEDVKGLFDRNPWRLKPLTTLKWGMVLVGVGLGTLLASYLTSVHGWEDSTYPGLIALLGGLGLVVFYAVARGQQNNS